MAKYLDTSHISSELMGLLKEAKERIILVTFSLQVNVQIQERLKTKSKLGTLGEITIIYGNTDLKQTELQWMAEIDDLKVFQKKNLHAKCYINEKKAIICSMNLYDYSQTTNVEMGFLITKEEDPEAYEEMMQDIDDLRINGTRVKKPWLNMEMQGVKKSNEFVETDNKEIETKSDPSLNLSYMAQVRKQLLEDFRKDLSTRMKQKSEVILSDKAINEIISINHPSIAHLKKILDSEKKVKQIGDELLHELERAEKFVIGKVTDTRYQNNDFNYDQVKMVRFDDGAEMWYNTKRELPRKGALVGVRLNKDWFNTYMVLEKSDVPDKPSDPIINKPTSNNDLKSTKDLSFISGVSSRDINSTLVSFGLMKKNGNDWIVTNKGVSLGGHQKEGQYGKFVVWPEEVLDHIQLN